VKKQINFYRLIWLFFFVFFFCLMFQITLRYIPASRTASFLQIKQTEVEQVSIYIPVFYVHVYSAIVVLLAGFTQFNSNLLQKYSKLHRYLGYVYVITILLFAAPSGIFIGYFANGGLFAKISFMLLGILWFTFTLKALQTARKRDFAAHRNFMYRSFALTLSAITLRLWKVILVFLFHPAPMDVYQIIAWLGWIPNLLIAEWIIKKQSTL